MARETIGTHGSTGKADMKFSVQQKLSIRGEVLKRENCSRLTWWGWQRVDPWSEQPNGGRGECNSGRIRPSQEVEARGYSRREADAKWALVFDTGP